MHKPAWFNDQTVMVSAAPTCGISKSGGELPCFDPATGQPVIETVGEDSVEVIDDRLLADMEALRDGKNTSTLQHVPRKQFSMRLAVPSYYDQRATDALRAEINGGSLDGFTIRTLGDLKEDGLITIRNGHGSAPKDVRQGDVPYIKVSDLRAGTVNINPTNSVPRPLAEKFWGGAESGLKAFDLISPERASKNIGDFCVLMPGQERLLLTKEMIIIRAVEEAPFDQFYILWALTLKSVRQQWNRVVFMQTNREDVGKRYYEIEIPIPSNRSVADTYSENFRTYFKTIASARKDFSEYLDADGKHHFFLSGDSTE